MKWYAVTMQDPDTLVIYCRAVQVSEPLMAFSAARDSFKLHPSVSCRIVEMSCWETADKPKLA